MTLAELVFEQAKTLPEPLAREVLDFIGYLKERGDRPEWRDLIEAQTASLNQVWDNEDDQAWNDV